MSTKEKIAAKYLMLETRYRNCQERMFDGGTTGKFDISKVDEYHFEEYPDSFGNSIWFEVINHDLYELKQELHIWESLWTERGGKYIIKEVNKIVNQLNIKVNYDYGRRSKKTS